MKLYFLIPFILGVAGTCIGGMIIFYQPQPDNSIIMISGATGVGVGIVGAIFAHYRHLRALPVAPVQPIQNIYFVYQIDTNRDIPDLSKDTYILTQCLP
jgi:hypothetical protein